MNDAPTPSTTPPPHPVRYRWWVQALAMLTVVAMFVLIGIGGHVTSTGSGLAVPDWPTTFGHGMITAPPEVWWDNLGTRVEHAHRLKGMVVGLLTIAVAFTLLFTNYRRPWLVVLGFMLLLGVIIQGFLGGTRVTERSDFLAFVHGVLGQLLFCAIVLIATATGRTWLRLAPRVARWAAQPAWAKKMQWLALAAVAVLVGQLVLGAAVRHAGAGRAIPDFPTTYGRVIPPMSTESLRQAVAEWDAEHPLQPVWLPHQRVDDLIASGEIEPAAAESATWSLLTTQVHLQLAHRVFAFVVLGTILALVGFVALRSPGRGELVAPTMWIGVLVVLQVLLGASTVWTERSPMVATIHQATGAVLLAIATWLAIRVGLVAGQRDEHKLPESERAVSRDSGQESGQASSPGEAAPGLKGVTA